MLMTWICKNCSTANDDTDGKCIVCDMLKPSDSVRTLTPKRVSDLGLCGDVIIPTEFNHIGEYAFEGRDDITSVHLHIGVEIIEKEAFANCKSLKYVDCPHTLASIRSKAFAGCTSLDMKRRPKAVRVATDAFMSTTTDVPPKPAYVPPLYTPTPKPTYTPPSKPAYTPPKPTYTPTPTKPTHTTPKPSYKTTSYYKPKTSEFWSKISKPFVAAYDWVAELDGSPLLMFIMAVIGVITLPVSIFVGRAIGWKIFQYIIGSFIGIYIAVLIGALISYIDTYTSLYAYQIVPFINIAAAVVNFILIVVLGEIYLFTMIAVSLVFTGLSIYCAYLAYDDVEYGWSLLGGVAAVASFAPFVYEIIVRL